MIHEHPSDYYDTTSFTIHFPQSSTELWTRNDTMNVAEFMLKTSSVSSTAPFTFYDRHTIERNVSERTHSTPTPHTSEAPCQSASSRITDDANPAAPLPSESRSLAEPPITVSPSPPPTRGSATPPGPLDPATESHIGSTAGANTAASSSPELPPLSEPPITTLPSSPPAPLTGGSATPPGPLEPGTDSRSGSAIAAGPSDKHVADGFVADSGQENDKVTGPNTQGGGGSTGDMTETATDINNTTSTSANGRTKGRKRKASEVSKVEK